MSPRDNRAALLSRLNRFFDVRRMMREEDISALELADALLSLKPHFSRALGGPPFFTGNNRAFANGAIGYEVICKKCKKAFWVTAIPYALCADCDNIGLFRR